MPTKKTVWLANGSHETFDTEAGAIHWERVLNTADKLRGIASGLTEKDRRSIAAWILTHFVPKSSAGPQAAYPPAVHAPGAPQPYAQPQAPAPQAPAPQAPAPQAPAQAYPKVSPVTPAPPYDHDQINRLTSALVDVIDVTNLSVSSTIRQLAKQLYSKGVRIEPSLPKQEY